MLSCYLLCYPLKLMGIWVFDGHEIMMIFYRALIYYLELKFSVIWSMAIYIAMWLIIRVIIIKDVFDIYVF